MMILVLSQHTLVLAQTMPIVVLALVILQTDVYGVKTLEELIVPIPELKDA